MPDISATIGANPLRLNLSPSAPGEPFLLDRLHKPGIRVDVMLASVSGNVASETRNFASGAGGCASLGQGCCAEVL